jgi:uncharacterized protein (DUF1684 family)
MNKQYIIGGIAVVSITAVVYIVWGMILTADYQDELLDARQEKAIWMSTSLESPFNEQQVVFNGLSYYDPDPSYNIVANFQKSESNEQITLIANDGEERTYDLYGTASFKIVNVPCTLQVLSSESELGTKMFIPFMDETSGEETYGAGRYLEASLPLGNTIDLDFNFAYNPYCAYMEGYTCPFPPKENKLNVAIKAGEKDY